MKERFEQKEQEKKYTLPDKNIFALGENSEINEKLKDFFSALEKEGIKWPLEIQGSGITLPEEKEFKVFYPKGDVFISFVVTIHELGHLRQFEADSSFERIMDETPKGKLYTLKNLDDLTRLEKNAWERGLQRFCEYDPETLNFIEEKFKNIKKKGKLSKFENFSEYFTYIRKMIESILPINKKIQTEGGKVNKNTAKSLAKMIKENPDLSDFFTNQDMWRVGEEVNNEEIEGFIRKVAKGIADEKYD